MFLSQLIKIPSNVMKEIWALLKETLESWLQDNASRMAAALAFYTTFSIGPAMLIGVAVAETFVSASVAESELITRLEQFMSTSDATYILNLLQNSRDKVTGRPFPMIGVGAAFFGAMVVFSELQSGLNTIWNVRLKRGSSILRYIYTRVVSFVLVVGIGFLLLLSIAISTLLTTIGAFVTDTFPVPPHLIHSLNSIISFAMIPLLVALAYKLIPAVSVAWKHVWAGCVVASLLLLVGKSIVGTYLSVTRLSSAYGAAGSLVILLVLVYYSAQVFFFGAELTKVYARRYGQPVAP